LQLPPPQVTLQVELPSQTTSHPFWQLIVQFELTSQSKEQLPPLHR
jgi:hypothetical protein